MNRLIEAFSNATPKTDEFSGLMADFPELFCSSNLPPINLPRFSAQSMNDVPNAMKNSLVPRRWSPSNNLESNSAVQATADPERFTAQTRKRKFSLRKSMLYEILTNRPHYEFFAHFLESDQDPSERIWLLINDPKTDDTLHGPYSTSEMQLKFEDSSLSPDSTIKRRLDENFTDLFRLMDTFVKSKIVKRFSAGETPDTVINLFRSQTENQNLKNLLDKFICESSDRKPKISSYDSEDSEFQDFENWLKFFTRKISGKRGLGIGRAAHRKGSG
jgi:hypothetical protein